MQGNSRPVFSNQTDLHPDLKKQVLKHSSTEFLQEIKAHSKTVFAEIQSVIQQSSRPLILDSGCGTGESSKLLAQRYTNHLIIGVDKSQHRLERDLNGNPLHREDNLILVRCDLVDFWRLAVQAAWSVDQHFILYPNPWPKKKHLSRRWYAHPVMPYIVKLGGRLECRSNWQLYIEEFSESLQLIGKYLCKHGQINPSTTLTPFEKKYRESGHKLYQLVCHLS